MIGDFRHVMTLQQKVLTPDGAGGFTQIWQDVALDPTVHAFRAAASGGKGRDAQQDVYVERWRIVTRYRADILPGMRLVEEGVAYEVLSAQDPDGRYKLLEIAAEKRT